MDPRYQAWLSRDPDPQTRQELQDLIAQDNAAELHERFDARLEFGTAGLRGLLGAGPGRMNRLVVRETSAGLGNYLLAQVPDAKERGVVVGFDGRRGSRIFAEDAASVFGALGLRVHLFDREAPTPVTGFAVRQLHAAAGVVITASHNPPRYNGYKVYWGNGAQIIPPHDADIAAAIDRAAQAAIPWQEPAALRRSGGIASLGGKMEQSYLDGVARLSVHRPSASRNRMVIAYTPLHGVGARLAEAALAKAGFGQVHTVANQREPDGAFPTVPFPNPEEPGAMDGVIELARQTQADLACANDPDADRLAVAARLPDGTYRQLSGNEVGILLGEDLLRRAPKNAVVASTIVSSQLLGRMCAVQRVEYFETLTGFKWIANGMLDQVARGKKPLFAYEEALGYSIGDLVWDKDGISALVAFAELAANCLETGTTLWQRLEAIAREHGLFATGQRTLQLQHAEQGGKLGAKLRRAPPDQIAGIRVVRTTDLAQGQATHRDGQRDIINLPKSDVLIFYLEDGTRVIVRPSGTEPKIKCYYEMPAPVPANANFAAVEAALAQRLDEFMNAHQRDLAIL